MKKQLNVRIDEDLYEDLKKYTKSTSVGYASRIQNVVEIAIREYLDLRASKFLQKEKKENEKWKN